MLKNLLASFVVLSLSGISYAQGVGEADYQGNILMIGDSVWTTPASTVQETIDGRATEDGFVLTKVARQGRGVNVSEFCLFGIFCSVTVAGNQSEEWEEILDERRIEGAFDSVTCVVISLGANDRNSDMTSTDVERIYDAAEAITGDVFWYLPQLNAAGGGASALTAKRNKITSVVPASRRIDVSYDIGSDGLHPSGDGVDDIMDAVEGACASL